MPHPLSVAFIWHMHQPYYRDPVTGESSMPWVRLHATKDYVDMLTRLEAFPTIHQTFNVVPSLLDQLEEYLPPANRSDVFFTLSQKLAAALSEEEQRFLLQWFFLANIDRMIKPYPRYHDLFVKRGLKVNDQTWPAIHRRFRTQDYLDLQVWLNLAWIDPWLRSQDAQLAGLEAKGSQFTEEEKRYVLEQHRHLIAQVIPAYRAAAARGQVELTTSPYYHPILPLLCDTRSALAALSHLSLPHATFRYPEDAMWQLQQGLKRHERAFGALPRGLWPPEGSVSEESARLAIDAGVRWIATDEEILWRTLHTPRAPSLLYRPHLLKRNNGQLAIIFRDRELSDLIGFVYSQWDPQVAVTDFLERLGQIHHQRQTETHPPLVSIILDGENAWEAYPQDGHVFLMTLYHALATDSRFRCVTVSEFLEHYPLQQTPSLPELFSGSWIDANFATWIGHPEKNAAWEHLAAARGALAPFSREDPAFIPAWNSLAVAEGSDWMWWFGDTHFSAQAQEFDRLFRAHLTNCYTLTGLEVPSTLTMPIRRYTTHTLYDPTGPISPVIDGRETSYYEWLYAGHIDLRQQYSAIHRGDQCLQSLAYGFDRLHYYLRFDVSEGLLAKLGAWVLELTLAHGVRVQVQCTDALLRATALSPQPTELRCALQRILEIAIPFKVLGLTSQERLPLTLTLMQNNAVLERYPAQGVFELTASLADLEAQAWLL